MRNTKRNWYEFTGSFLKFMGKSLAEFAPAGANKVLTIFSGDMCVGENTSRLANVRAQRVRCGEPQPFQTRAQRSGSRLRACQKTFFDKLRAAAFRSSPWGISYQPLTAPIVTPSRKYFCNVKNRMNIGSAESVAPAIMGAKSVSFANLKVLRPTWIVNI